MSNIVYLPGFEPPKERSEQPCAKCGCDDREINWSLELQLSVCLGCYRRYAVGQRVGW